MAIATITDTFLDKPFNRKTDFSNALKTALTNAGFPVGDLDTFDITDAHMISMQGAGATTFNAGNANSIAGFVKNYVVNSGATTGTFQFVFFTRGAWATAYGGTGIATTTTDSGFCPGMYPVLGGWDTTNKRPTSTVDGNCIGGYTSDYSAALTQSTTANEARYTYHNGNSGALAKLPTGCPYNSAATSTDNSTFPYNYSNAIFFKAINHPEIRGVFIQQANRQTIFLGYIRPENLPTWWNENSHPYIFTSPNADLLNFRMFSGVNSPYSSATQANSYRIGNLSLGAGNAANSSKRDVIASPLMLDAQTQTGIIGRFSNDIILTNYSVFAQFDKLIVTPGVEEYLILSQSRYGRPATVNTLTYTGNIDTTTYSLGVRIV